MNIYVQEMVKVAGLSARATSAAARELRNSLAEYALKNSRRSGENLAHYGRIDAVHRGEVSAQHALRNAQEYQLRARETLDLLHSGELENAVRSHSERVGDEVPAHVYRPYFRG